MNLAFIIAAFIFLIGALAALFGWDLKKFDPLMWGLFFFALGHLWAWILPSRSNQ